MAEETIRLATFNAENLFARYRFNQSFNPTNAEGFMINDLAFDLHDDASKRITAQVIKDVDADVICIQEVESLTVLERFNSRYLARLKYRHRVVIDATDPRKIDLGVLSRYPIVGIRSNRHVRNQANTAYLFTRDCLEVDISVPGSDGGASRTLTILANHLKSMIGGRENTRKRRIEQVRGLVKIIDERFGPDNYGANFAIVGDFNDFTEGRTSLTALLNHPELVNISDRVDEPNRWTHYYARGAEYKQLDYIWLGRRFDDAAGGPVPGTHRKGLPWRAEEYEGQRYEAVGENYPKASDHVPLYVDLPLAAFV